MGDRIAGAVRPVMCRDEVLRLYQIKAIKKILRVIRPFPLRQTQFHVNEKVNASLYAFQSQIRNVHVPRVQYGDVLFRVGHQIPARRGTRIRVFSAFDCFNF